MAGLQVPAAGQRRALIVAVARWIIDFAPAIAPCAQQGEVPVRFFKRGAQEQPGAGGDFWEWWDSGRDQVAAAIAGGGFDKRLVEDIGRAVKTIHPHMAWELAPGSTAEHAFCLSSEGNREVRQAALRWLATAPAADATWEYHASKQASPRLMGLEIAGTHFDLEEMRAIASWDDARQRLDVRLWHPLFATVPEPIRLQAAFVFLDQLLGEDDVERWIGQIDILDAPTGGRTPNELRAEVDRHRSESSADATWILAQMDRPEGPMFVTANAALKRIDHPFDDYYAQVSLVFEGGLPQDDLAEALNREEDDLLPRFDGLAIYAARTTEAGKRTLHFVTQDTDRLRPAIDAWAADLPDELPGGVPRRIKVGFGRDMDWSFQRELGIR